MDEKAALLIVDVQNDFCPGGALPVPNGDRVIEPLNRAIERFVASGLPVLASRDWHLPASRHFSQYGGNWPVHCLQETTGADFHPGLRLPAGTVLITKGIQPDLDGYSAFEGVSEDGTFLSLILEKMGVQHLYIAGLATDYCILFTARDALQNGLAVTVLTDAVAGVDITAHASETALRELQSLGAWLATVDEL